MKKLKRCLICHKRMWWWQAIWENTFHFKCATRIVSLQREIESILEKSKK